MINVCDKCGGLYTTANEERYAGTPCQCPNRQPDIGRYIRFDHAAAIPALPTVQPTPTTTGEPSDDKYKLVCFHSMVRPDCLGCMHGHARRLESQLQKLEASTALPIKERIERAVCEQMEHCYQVYKGVPPTVDDWVGGALHYIMWGLERDLPLAAQPAFTTEARAACVWEFHADAFNCVWNKTECGINDASFGEEDRFRFCPYCGGEIQRDGTTIEEVMSPK